ncbi:MAG: ATP-binding protein, partial [Candidatus Bathyarchaeota archaeon]|nr:ATP-binding protein [Candidatus Bathyarchaeota archaeon]
IGNREKIIVTSCASGPAFEGSGIKCGTGAIEGAISQIEIKDDLSIEYETIDDASPSGICGSGLIDVLAEMLDRNIIDKKGKFLKGENRFTIKENGKPIFIDGEDIDNLKLAKAAIHVGTKAVMRHYGVELKDVERLCLAGAFGNYIDPIKAIEIGMLPDISLEKVERVGNAAIEGARQALISKEKRKDAEVIPKKTKHIRLEMEKNFQDQFVNGLLFDKYE